MTEDLTGKTPKLSFAELQFKREFGCTRGQAELGWRDILKQYSETLSQLDQIKGSTEQTTDEEEKQISHDKETELLHTKSRLEGLTIELLRLLEGKLDYEEFDSLLTKIRLRKI